jgi:lipoprotein-anchoring transpeptidase ErfK/SrfK
MLMPCVRSSSLALGLLIAGLASSTAFAQPYGVRREAANAPRYQVQTSAPQYRHHAAPARGGMGGGFIEAVFGNPDGAMAPRPQARGYGGIAQPDYATPQYEDSPVGRGQRQPYMRGYQYDAYGDPQQAYGYGEPSQMSAPEQRPVDPQYRKQTVQYDGKHAPGTIIIDTPQRFLYLVEGNGTATRYGIGVGRPGFTWAGMKSVTRKAEWPDWRPPDEMLRRRPDLPRFMPGGPDNPLGARALYLGSSLYRIHGSNEPWTIGTAVSSGCIRMRNEDVIDLYTRVKVGTKVVVI